MIKHIEIQNFRSFVKAEVALSPFSLIVGANGSGKTNLLRFLSEGCNLNSHSLAEIKYRTWPRHIGHPNLPVSFGLTNTEDRVYSVQRAPNVDVFRSEGSFDWSGCAIIFNLDADDISASEVIRPKATVASSGSGTTAVLESLKSGDREELFSLIEARFKQYVPEVEKLSLKTTGEGTKQIQIREKGLPDSLPAPELSEGTRIILAILTIIHQEQPPAMILLEDIDRGLHPRLFEYLAPLLREIAVQHDINIVATTHNPYLVDAMQDHKEAVIIVEKKDGASTLTTLASRLDELDYDKVDPDDMPLGQLWFSGLVGGTPVSISNKPER